MEEGGKSLHKYEVLLRKLQNEISEEDEEDKILFSQLASSKQTFENIEQKRRNLVKNTTNNNENKQITEKSLEKEFSKYPTNKITQIIDLMSYEDGNRSETESLLCKCGYKHWLFGKEVDVIIHSSIFGSVFPIGVSVGDNARDLAIQFFSRFCIEEEKLIEELTNKITQTFRKKSHLLSPISLLSNNNYNNYNNNNYNYNNKNNDLISNNDAKKNSQKTSKNIKITTTNSIENIIPNTPKNNNNNINNNKEFKIEESIGNNNKNLPQKIINNNEKIDKNENAKNNTNNNNNPNNNTNSNTSNNNIQSSLDEIRKLRKNQHQLHIQKETQNENENTSDNTSHKNNNSNSALHHLEKINNKNITNNNNNSRNKYKNLLQADDIESSELFQNLTREEMQLMGLLMKHSRMNSVEITLKFRGSPDDNFTMLRSDLFSRLFANAQMKFNCKTISLRLIQPEVKEMKNDNFYQSIGEIFPQYQKLVFEVIVLHSLQ